DADREAPRGIRGERSCEEARPRALRARSPRAPGLWIPRMQGEHETQRSIGRRDARVVARQRWRDLLLLHWPAPLDALRARVPASLELDTHEGRAWVSVLAFRAEHTRPRGVPSQWGLDFDEL